ncbi:hypothetical protein VTN96DRAFT_8847 [Rasamsonia emersonii]
MIVGMADLITLNSQATPEFSNKQVIATADPDHGDHANKQSGIGSARRVSTKGEKEHHILRTYGHGRRTLDNRKLYTKENGMVAIAQSGVNPTCSGLGNWETMGNERKRDFNERKGFRKERGREHNDSLVGRELDERDSKRRTDQQKSRKRAGEGESGGDEEGGCPGEGAGTRGCDGHRLASSGSAVGGNKGLGVGGRAGADRLAAWRRLGAWQLDGASQAGWNGQPVPGRAATACAVGKAQPSFSCPLVCFALSCSCAGPAPKLLSAAAGQSARPLPGGSNTRSQEHQSAPRTWERLPTPSPRRINCSFLRVVCPALVTLGVCCWPSYEDGPAVASSE